MFLDPAWWLLCCCLSLILSARLVCCFYAPLLGDAANENVLGDMCYVLSARKLLFSGCWREDFVLSVCVLLVGAGSMDFDLHNLSARK